MTWIGRALVAASAAGMVYAAYLMLGRGWAIILASFFVYVYGYSIATSKKQTGLIAGEDLSHGAVCTIGVDGKVYRYRATTDRARNETPTQHKEVN